MKIGRNIRPPLQKTGSFLGGGHPAGAALAEPAVAVSGGPLVDGVTQAPRDNAYDLCGHAPGSAEDGAEVDHGIAFHDERVGARDHIDGGGRTHHAVRCKEFFADGRLKRRKAKLAGWVVTHQKVNGVVAQRAHAVKDHDGVVACHTIAMR